MMWQRQADHGRKHDTSDRIGTQEGLDETRPITEALLCQSDGNDGWLRGFCSCQRWAGLPAMALDAASRGDLERWLWPFLAALSHPARRHTCPVYVAGLIGPGDRKSMQPMAARAG